MTFFLFPGQGSQQPGMAHDFYQGCPAARQVLDQAASVLGPEILTLMFQGPADALKDTRAAQPALVAAGVAVAQSLIARGIQPTGVAGHSVGEIAALVVANVLSLEDALRLTRERARLMAGEVPPGGMAAVLGLPPDAIAQALPTGAEVANFNGPQQTIISGSVAALESATGALKTAGAKRVIPLPVSGPFHSSWMRPAGQALAKFLETISFSAPTIAFISSVAGAQESNPESIRQLLARQIFSPVLWTQVMAAIGPVEALETGPGNVLQGLAKRMDGAPIVRPAGTLEAVMACAAT